VVEATRVSGDRPGGGRFTRAVVGSFEVTRLEFPANFRHGAFAPERDYLVVVLHGAVCKTFAGDTTTLSRGSFATLPAGSTHSSSFAPEGTQVLAVRAAPGCEPGAFGSMLSRRRHVRASASSTLGWRMASELDAGDASWSLALEGLVLQLLATAGRASLEPTRGAGAWVSTVRDALHDQAPGPVSLERLAAAVGRHPTHVARAFRREYGLTVCQYARALTLDWAASQLLLDDASLARVALEAGFVDQSHFTRAFRRHTGVTPGRYRELLRPS
jgi:AraC family transcriptional regulator